MESKNSVTVKSVMECIFFDMGYMSAKTLPISVKLNIVGTDIAEIEESVSKVHYFLSCNDHSIVINPMDPMFTEMFSMRNNVIMLPFDVSDMGLAKVLCSKFNAITANSIEVESVTISSGQNFDYTVVDSSANMPTESDEYLSDDWISKLSDPWWNRDDGFTFEIIKHVDDPDDFDEIYKNIADPLLTFSQQYNESRGSESTEDKTEATVHQGAVWIPKEIN